MSLARPSLAAAAPCLLRGSSSRGAGHSGRRVAVARRAAGDDKAADVAGGEKMGVIIVDHGSRRQASNLLLVGE